MNSYHRKIERSFFIHYYRIVYTYLDTFSLILSPRLTASRSIHLVRPAQLSRMTSIVITVQTVDRPVPRYPRTRCKARRSRRRHRDGP